MQRDGGDADPARDQGGHQRIGERPAAEAISALPGTWENTDWYAAERVALVEVAVGDLPPCRSSSARRSPSTRARHRRLPIRSGTSPRTGTARAGSGAARPPRWSRRRRRPGWGGGVGRRAQLDDPGVVVEAGRRRARRSPGRPRTASISPLTVAELFTTTRSPGSRRSGRSWNRRCSTPSGRATAGARPRASSPRTSGGAGAKASRGTSNGLPSARRASSCGCHRPDARSRRPCSVRTPVVARGARGTWARRRRGAAGRRCPRPGRRPASSACSCHPGPRRTS